MPAAPPPGGRTGPPIRSRAAAAARASQDAGKKSDAVPAPAAPPPRASSQDPRPSVRSSSSHTKAPDGGPGSSTQRSSRSVAATAPPQALPRGLPESQRTLLMALRDEMAAVESHPAISTATIATAKRVFEAYVIEQWSAGIGLAGTSLTADFMEQVFADLGIPMTANDVRDLLFDMNQSADIVFHNAKTAALRAEVQAHALQANTVGGAPDDEDDWKNGPPVNVSVTPPPDVADHAGGTETPSVQRHHPPDSRRRSGAAGTARHVGGGATPTAKSSAPSASTAAATAALKAQNSGAITVGFCLFLELLGTTLGDCSYRDEMAMLWHHLDADADDALSEADLRQAFAALARTAADVGAPPAHLASMIIGDARLSELVEELDVDDDGVVSKKDFLSSVNAN